MDKEITIEEFTREVSILWGEERYSYGSVQYPAAEVRDRLIKSGVTNTQEIYDEYKRRKGDLFYYAGD